MEIEPGKKFATIDQYQLIKTLGQGYNAKVKLGLNVNDGSYVAVKIFKKTHAFEKNKSNLMKEFEVMQKLKHPYLVNLVEIKPEADYHKKNGQTYKTCAIVIEYAKNGELFEYVSQGGQFPEQIARTYFRQMIEGLEYLHGQGFAHRDMKPENLLFDENFSLKIADFGFATVLAGKDGSGLLRTILGTESYMAPEINNNTPYSGTAVDIFATGIILFIMIAGHPPFMKADPKADAYFKCLCTNRHNTFWQAHSKTKPGKEKFFSNELKDLFNSLFAQDPAQRPTIAEIKNHAWYNGPFSDLSQIKSDFDKRKQLVFAELDRQKQQKLLEKQQRQEQSQQQNFIYTGVGKFRGRTGQELNDIFAGLEGVFPTVANQRKSKNYDKNAGKPSDFLSVLDQDFIFKLLLLKRENYCKELYLHESQFKLKCKNIDENGIVNAFNIELLKSDDDTICVDFTRTEGSSITFKEQTDKIKEILKEQDQKTTA